MALPLSCLDKAVFALHTSSDAEAPSTWQAVGELPAASWVVCAPSCGLLLFPTHSARALTRQPGQAVAVFMAGNGLQLVAHLQFGRLRAASRPERRPAAGTPLFETSMVASPQQLRGARQRPGGTSVGSMASQHDAADEWRPAAPDSRYIMPRGAQCVHAWVLD